MNLSSDEIIDIVKKTGGEILKKPSETILLPISTDTRTISAGDLYLPLKGESFDGEKFIEKALQNGAVGYFTTGDKIFENAQMVFKIKDALMIYLEAARFLRAKIAPQTIAVTGSSGKTTVKEMIYSVLSEKFVTQKTELNHNNEVGFCQTIFSMPEDCQMLILEMGMRGFGEIELLSKYAQPDVAVISNVGTAHIGRLGSRENIAKAKCEIFSGLKKDGVLFSQKNELVKTKLPNAIFLSAEDAEIKQKNKSGTKFIYKKNMYELNVAGDFNVENALFAIEIGLRYKMSPEEIASGLKKYKPIEKRWEAEEACGYRFINDSYNANPESVKASVKTFLENYSGVVILGDMGELGDEEKAYHRGVGEFIKNLPNSNNVKFLTCGELSAQTAETLGGVENFSTTKQAAEYILAKIPVGTTIFLKASRSQKFEEIIRNIKGENQ